MQARHVCVCAHTKRTYFYCFPSAGLLQNYSYNTNMLRTCKILNVEKTATAYVTVPVISVMLKFGMYLSLANNSHKNVRFPFLSVSLFRPPKGTLVYVCLNA